jgi:hypothetical protein
LTYQFVKLAAKEPELVVAFAGRDLTSPERFQA